MKNKKNTNGKICSTLWELKITVHSVFTVKVQFTQQFSLFILFKWDSLHIFVADSLKLRFSRLMEKTFREKRFQKNTNKIYNRKYHFLFFKNKNLLPKIYIS